MIFASAGRRRNGISFAQAMLAVAVIASTALLLVLDSHLSFILDDWTFLLDRRGFSAGTFLDPHNEHIAIIPVAIYKLLLEVFGMTSALPFQVVATLLLAATGILLFAYLRDRVGEWLALFASCIVLFLGPAWIDLLWSFQLAFSGSAAAGIGMLLALRSESRAGDRLACALLTVSLAFSSFGLAFAAGAVVDLLLSRRPRRERAYVALVPIALFGIWWLGWGHNAENSVSWHNALESPNYSFDAVGQVIASVTGLAHSADPNQLGGLFWGHRILVVLVLLAIWRLWTLRRIPRQLVVVLAIGAGFWFLAALNANFLRPPTSGRYQYPGAICLFLILAELVRGIRLRPWMLACAGAVTAAIVVSNIRELHDGWLRGYRPITVSTRSQLTGLEIARPSLRSGYQLLIALTPQPPADYYSAVRAYGSPAYSRSELPSASDTTRTGVDLTLLQAFGLHLDQHVTGSAGGVCSGMPVPRGGRTISVRTPGRVVFKGASRRTEVRIGRFADGSPLSLGFLAPGKPAQITFPPDLSKRPWRVELIGPSHVTTCRVLQ